MQFAPRSCAFQHFHLADGLPAMRSEVRRTSASTEARFIRAIVFPAVNMTPPWVSEGNPHRKDLVSHSLWHSKPHGASNMLLFLTLIFLLTFCLPENSAAATSQPTCSVAKPWAILTPVGTAVLCPVRSLTFPQSLNTEHQSMVLTGGCLESGFANCYFYEKITCFCSLRTRRRKTT